MEYRTPIALLVMCKGSWTETYTLGIYFELNLFVKLFWKMLIQLKPLGTEQPDEFDGFVK